MKRMDLTQFTPSSALITVIVVSLAPFVGVMVTSFTKIIVVLSLLRNALGLLDIRVLDHFVVTRTRSRLRLRCCP